MRLPHKSHKKGAKIWCFETVKNSKIPRGSQGRARGSQFPSNFYESFENKVLMCKAPFLKEGLMIEGFTIPNSVGKINCGNTQKTTHIRLDNKITYYCI